MPLYAITIKEILSKTVVTNAKTLDKAIDKVTAAYQNGDIEIGLEVTDVDIDASEYYKNGIISEEDANDYEIIRDDKELWELAQQIAKKRYEEDDNGDWEEADKYAREDYVHTTYMRLKGK